VQNESQSLVPSNQSDERWKFLRDVVVFQLKMLIDNVRDFALIPVSLGAAAIDLVYKGEREGALFYKVLEWGAQSEKIIDVYSPIEHRLVGSTINSDYTIDGVVARLERVVVKECEKGGSAASIKAAMDRAIDQLHSETGAVRDKATDVVSRAALKLREKFPAQPGDD
jgi:hypothetical protein